MTLTAGSPLGQKLFQSIYTHTNIPTHTHLFHNQDQKVGNIMKRYSFFSVQFLQTYSFLFLLRCIIIGFGLHPVLHGFAECQSTGRAELGARIQPDTLLCPKWYISDFVAQFCGSLYQQRWILVCQVSSFFHSSARSFVESFCLSPCVRSCSSFCIKFELLTYFFQHNFASFNRLSVWRHFTASLRAMKT